MTEEEQKQLAKNLATKLRANPSYFDDVDDSLLVDFLLNYRNDELTNPEDIEEAKRELSENPRAKEIWKKFEQADQFAKSEEGQQFTEELIKKVFG
jgi:hypothetical protein